MRIQLLGSTVGGEPSRQQLTTWVINDTVAIDAGSLGLWTPPSAQAAVRQVFISHMHLDHIATLPLFLDAVFSLGEPPPEIYAGPEVWDCLDRDMFTDRMWPDLERAAPTLQFYLPHTLQAETPVQVGSLTITPVAVDHVVPTFGFLIEDEQDAVLISSDTGPTTRLWELARRPDFAKKLRAAFIECSFSNDLEWLAERAKHLCPHRFLGEVRKLSPAADVAIVAVHLKFVRFEQVREELAALKLPNLTAAESGQVWDF